jgi:hypothetical protein
MAAAAAAATVARAGAGAVEGFCAASPAALAAQAPWFHLLVTVPAGLQVATRARSVPFNSSFVFFIFSLSLSLSLS